MIIVQEPDQNYFNSGAFGIHSLLDFEGEDGWTKRRFYERHVAGNREDQDTKAKTLGRAAHKWILEGEHDFLAAFAVRPKGIDMRRTRAKEVLDWKKKKGDKPEITYEECQMLRNMFAEVRTHKDAAPLLRDGFPEVTMRVKHPNGLNVQARADWLACSSDNGKLHTPSYIVDLKTCECLDGFKRDMKWRRYHRQAAFYQWIAFLEMGERVPFYFVAVEKMSGHRVGVYEVDEAAMLRAHDANMRLCDAVQECFESGKWESGSPEGIQVVTESELFSKEAV